MSGGVFLALSLLTEDGRPELGNGVQQVSPASRQRGVPAADLGWSSTQPSISVPIADLDYPVWAVFAELAESIGVPWRRHGEHRGGDRRVQGLVEVAPQTPVVGHPPGRPPA